MGAKHPKNSGYSGEKYIYIFIQFFAYELYFFSLLF